MKKSVLAISALSLFIAASASAKPQFCGYLEHFHADQYSPPSLQITSLSNDGNVSTQYVDAIDFNISDATNCPMDGGYAYVTYSVDPAHFCNLTIHDGPNMWNPAVSANCQGLSFNGISYDGVFSYSYSLKFR